MSYLTGKANVKILKSCYDVQLLICIFEMVFSVNKIYILSNKQFDCDRMKIKFRF